MKTKHHSCFLAFICMVFTLSNLYAQDIKVDVKDVKKEYTTNFSTAFKISFSNADANAKKNVRVKTDVTVPSNLKTDADLTVYEIPFTVSSGALTTKDKDNKEVKISKNSFQVFLDDISFIVKRSNDLSVDYASVKADYKANYKENFKITFNKADANIKKIEIKSKADKTATLYDKNDSKKAEITFTFKDNKLIVKDNQNADFAIDESPFTISIDDKKFTVTNDITTSTTPDKPKEGEPPAKQEKVPYWSYLQNNKFDFSLQSHMLVTGVDPDPNCSDDCKGCDDDAFTENNRIIYNAKSGVTYFVDEKVAVADKLCPGNAANYKDYKVNNSNKIKMSSGDPLVFIIENVNPALYDIELSDTTILTNNESNGLLESLLFQKSEKAVTGLTYNTVIQAGDDDAKNKLDEQEYIKVKTALIMIKSEMEGLLENLKRSSPYLHNCIQEKKRKALVTINGFTDKISVYDGSGKNATYKDQTILELADLFLNQEAEDVKLNQQIKALYGEFIAATYKIAYRYPQLPQKDMLNFKLSIKAKPNSPYPSLLNVKMEDPTQTVYIKDFFKIDVSTGLYMGFKKDQSYTLQNETITVPNDDNTGTVNKDMKRIVKQDDSNNEFGFASFLHFYYKYSTWCNLGASIGAGLSFDKTVRPRYFTGVSLLLGNNNRICINAGVVWGNYEDLSNEYKKTGDYDLLESTATSLNYTTRFKSAGYVSLSYNIPFIVRKNSTDAKPE